jgi:chromosome partitioning protein
MTTITFSAIKGGVGKSSLAILTANFLASCGYKTLIIDADPQNSTTFYYLPDTKTDKSLAAVLQNGDIITNIIDTNIEGVDIIPSALELFILRNCDTGILEKVLKPVGKCGYDFCIIDTAPNFDNVVVNAILSANLIITPVQLTGFDLKSTIFYKSLLHEIGKLDEWRIVHNKFKPIKSGGSVSGQLLTMFESSFKKSILNARIPETVVLKNYFNTQDSITKAKAKLQTFEAITSFVTEVAGNITVSAKAF